jgi:Ca-activated chloride channel family protein
MRRLAAETGGAYFEVSKDHSIEWIYAQIEDALRNQYNIGYTPLRPAVGGQYRKIELTTKQPGLVVRARAGYYSK